MDSVSGAPRDDGAPAVDALRTALADAQTAFSSEDDRHAALGWLLSHLSSLIADSERLKELDAQREAMYRAGPPLTEEQRRTAEDGAREIRWRGYAQKRARVEPPSAPPHTGASDE